MANVESTIHIRIWERHKVFVVLATGEKEGVDVQYVEYLHPT